MPLFLAQLKMIQQYRGNANGLRFICEILSIIFVVFYLLKEIDQAERWVTTIVGLQIQVSKTFWER